MSVPSEESSEPVETIKKSKVESIKQFLLQSNKNQSVHQSQSENHPVSEAQCNCRHHVAPVPPVPPGHQAPFLLHPPPNLIHRRSKSSERLNARMTLPPNATPSLLPPTAAALIGPFIYFQPPEVSRFRRRNSSLENLNEIFLNDETSDKPKEDRIVKFKDEVVPEESGRGRSRSKKAITVAPPAPSKAVGASILKDSSKKSETKTSESSANPTETKPVIKSIKKVKAPLPPSNPASPMTAKSKVEVKVEKEEEKVEISMENCPENKAEKEESGYDSDQTLATLSNKDSASEASSLNSPPTEAKKDTIPVLMIGEPMSHCDSDVEQDLSLESIITQNESRDFRLVKSQPNSLMNTMLEPKFTSLDPSLMTSTGTENVTSVEVSWLNHQKDLNKNPSETEIDDELKALCAVDEADKVSVTSSVPMDFGESLPPTLTTLMHKQFSLYRLFKEAEAELGVLITKKIQRDRRTSGYVIAYIEPNGLVDKDGRFKVGDELINVNGHSLRGLSMEAARNVLRQLSGHVDIIVARQPQETPPSTNAGKSD